MAENNHIEEFFRNRLASNDFAFQEEDWLKMEQKLGASGISSAGTAISHFTTKTIIIIIAGLTAAFILGWLASELQGNKKNSNGQVIPEKNIPVDKRSSPFDATMKPLKSGVKADSANHIDIVAQGEFDNTEGFPINSGIGSEKTKIANVHRDNTDLQRSLTSSIGHLPADMNSLPSTYNEHSSFSNENDDINSYKETDINFLPQPGKAEYQLTNNLSHDLPLLTLPGSSEPALYNRHFSRISVGLIFAPDFNSAGLLHRKSVSPVAGAFITYNFTPRWSLSTRILYNNKKYNNGADYYNVPYEYWTERTNGIIPNNIDASCRVIDVPILLTYRFFVRPRLAINASAGPGSYFLLDEKYEFNFRQDNPGAATQWQTHENSKALFGVFNLALGLEMHTGRNTSIGIEPYLKIPLKQMGWANVNLSGMGLSFSVKYNF